MWPRIQGQIGLLFELRNPLKVAGEIESGGIGRFKIPEHGTQYIADHFSQFMFFICVCDYHGWNAIDETLGAMEKLRKEYVAQNQPKGS